MRPYVGKIIPFHCIANYPSKLGGQDLNVIDAFFHSGFGEVGYSSHDEDWEICILAMAFGAKWIERHVTLDKKEIGLDHSSSSDINELKKLVKFSQSFESVVGKDFHTPMQGELINLQKCNNQNVSYNDDFPGQSGSVQSSL